MKETKYNGYFVDEEGNVYSNKKGKLNKIKPWLTSKGRYWTFRIENKNILVHRLIAETYIPNPENKPEVNHKDSDSKNNKLSNLEWMTRKENMLHGFVRNSPVRNFTEAKVYKNNVYVGTFKTVTEACRFVEKEYNIPFSMIQKHKSYNGIQVVTEGRITDKHFGEKGRYIRVKKPSTTTNGHP